MKNLMAWKERGYDNAPSIYDFISETPYSELERSAIIHYLDNFGITTSASTGVGTDLLTGEMISVPYESKNDGEYAWMNTLSYYVKKV